MKILSRTLKWTSVLAIVVLASPLHAGEQPVLKTQTDKESYAAGVNMVRTLIKQGGEINLDAVIKGITDGLTGDKLLMTEDDLRRTMAGLEMSRQRGQAANMPDNGSTDVAGKGTKDDTGVRQDQERPEQPTNQVEQGGMLAQKKPAADTVETTATGPNNVSADQKAGGQARKAEQAGKSGQIAASTSGISVAERGQIRSAIKKRALEMRKKAIEQGL